MAGAVVRFVVGALPPACLAAAAFTLPACLPYLPSHLSLSSLTPRFIVPFDFCLTRKGKRKEKQTNFCGGEAAVGDRHGVWWCACNMPAAGTDRDLEKVGDSDLPGMPIAPSHLLYCHLSVHACPGDRKEEK